MGYSFTDLGAEGCRRSLNALFEDDLYVCVHGKAIYVHVIYVYILGILICASCGGALQSLWIAQMEFSLYFFPGFPSVLLIGINTLRPRENGRHFANDIFKCIIVNDNLWIPIKISLKFVPKGPINNIPALVQTMAWRRPGGKPLSEPLMVRLLTHICVTRPQWVNAGPISIKFCGPEENLNNLIN